MNTWIRLVHNFAVIATVVLMVGAPTPGCSEDIGCSQDHDCGSTRVCNQETRVCEPFVCGQDDDCVDPDQVCDNNACVARTAAQSAR